MDHDDFPLRKHAPPPLSAMPAKGILKSTRSTAQSLPPPRPGLAWNEPNLEETSKDRGTRQKIEEVETPYAWPGDYSIGTPTSRPASASSPPLLRSE